jgi:large subunit ribosomal protein L18
MAKKTERKEMLRQRRKRRVRKKILGTPVRPRLSVFRSSKHIYAQVIDDTEGVTLASASSVDTEFEREEDDTKVDCARRVGEMLAARCKEESIQAVVFDRNGYRYQSGRIRALAEGAREGGLNF